MYGRRPMLLISMFGSSLGFLLLGLAKVLADAGVLSVNLDFFELGTLFTIFECEMKDCGIWGPESETSGRDLACGNGLGGTWAYI